jgi:hypothetical protein
MAGAVLTRYDARRDRAGGAMKRYCSRLFGAGDVLLGL